MIMPLATKLSAIILVSATLSGCAVSGYRFEHPTKSEADFKKDQYECGLVVQQITNQSPNRGNPLITGPRAASEFADCMNYRYNWTRKPCDIGSPGCGAYFK